ncbi:hypothetical protein CEUSTIGMA_g5572.t1 [Chlamydomonas eustigma]|uniref:Spc7 kinetochore protein domain-containing protein n=1 Tax=Chlamydomonas eustigma TaxID=1157962 RepID=A0A250X5U7_9CHLO|nr:hypothetical protein CEUSTIGMA_g5572.t1 [Chlamydomonas eustigma]|eukprot:GAX78130.1 hypothetical protein CEUSTIGMA_g5572.t1 [Chlamydomonas eustigma]
MSQNISGPTPTTILRKRANKENEERESRKTKLRGRRVSFAPDDELETMHLYKKDKNQRLDDTDELLANTAVPYNSVVAHDGGVSACMQSPAPLTQMNIEISPMNTPLSMDLTNISLPAQPLPAEATGSPETSPVEFRHPSSQASLEYTRNITGGVPALSTLVEEDEDCLIEPKASSMSGAGESPTSGLLSPLSPFLVKEMRLDGERIMEGTPIHDDTEDLKNKWGFTPGAEDTLDASHGRRVMGDATYNNVYGNATTTGNVIMQSIKSSSHPVLGPQAILQIQRQHGNSNSMIAPNQQQVLAAGGGALRRRQTLPAEMTLKLLEEEELHHNASWQGDKHVAGHASVASNKITSALMSTSYNESTAGMWAPSPIALVGSYNTGAIPHAAGTTTLMPNTANTPAAINFTTQLLADTSRSHIDRTLQPLTFDRKLDAGAPGFISDPTVASSSALMGLFSQRNQHNNFLDMQSPQPFAGDGGMKTVLPPALTPTGMNFEPAPVASQHSLPRPLTHATRNSSFLVDPSLTLDDFALPPELPTNQQDLPNPSLSSQLIGSLYSMQQYNALYETVGTPLPSLPQMQEGLHHQQNFSFPHARSPILIPPARVIKQGNFSIAPQVPQISIPQHGHSVANLQQAMQQQQLSLAQSALLKQNPSMPQISFQEFLQVVEVRFLDDMRRRASLLQPPLVDLEQASSTQDSTQSLHTTTQSSAELLEALHVSGPRAVLSRKMVELLAERVEEVQARVTQAEAAMAKSNPEVFATVQRADTSDLARLRDQMKLLKRVCRLRTMMSWKQQRIQFEQELGLAHRGGMSFLQTELEVMEASLQTSQKLEEDLQSLHFTLAMQAQQQMSRRKALQDLKHKHAAQMRQLLELQASNKERSMRKLAVEEKLKELRARYESSLQDKLIKQRHLQSLQSQEVLQLTPSRGSRQAPAVVHTLMTQLMQQQEHLQVLQGLLGVQIDARGMRGGRGFQLRIMDQFSIQVDPLPNVASAVSSESFTMKAQLLHADGRSSLCSDLWQQAGHLFQGALWEVTASLDQLPSTLTVATAQLTMLSAAVTGLEAVMLSTPLLTSVKLVGGAEGGLTNAALELEFIEVKQVGIKVSLLMPFKAALLPSMDLKFMTNGSQLSSVKCVASRLGTQTTQSRIPSIESSINQVVTRAVSHCFKLHDTCLEVEAVLQAATY